MASVDDVANWAGVEGDLKDRLLLKLGKPTKLRDVVFIDRQTWDQEIKELKMPGPPDADGNATERALNPTEKSRVEIFRRVTFLRSQVPPDRPGEGAPAIAVSGTPLPPAGSQQHSAAASPTRRLKLSIIVDPTLDTELIQMSQQELTSLCTKYKAKYGSHPTPDLEPTRTRDQVSAVQQLVRSQTVPYADLSIFGPHGLRTLRRAVFKSYSLNASTGEWSKKEQPGPDSVITWEKAIKVFKVAMVLIEAVDSERLDAYLEHIKDLHNRFGKEAWGIIYRADCRMRSEYMDRIRRSLEEDPRHGYTTASPWSAVFAEAIRDHDFWTREVVTPSTLLLARNRSTATGLSDDTSESVEGSARSPSNKRKNTPRADGKKKKAKKKYTGEDKSTFDASSGTYSLNRKGIQICIKYNKGQCGNGKPQSRCPNSRSHQCSRCLGPHMGKDCRSPTDRRRWGQVRVQRSTSSQPTRQGVPKTKNPKRRKIRGHL